MALQNLAAYSSSESDSETNEPIDKPENQSASTSRKLLNSLPDPKSTDDSLKKRIIYEGDSGKSKKVKINLIDTTHLVDSDSSDEESTANKARKLQPTHGSGLRSLLPKPKIGLSTSLITSSISVPQVNRPTSRKAPIFEKTSTNEPIANFFSLDEKEKLNHEEVEVGRTNVKNEQPGINLTPSLPEVTQYSSTSNVMEKSYQQVINEKFGDEVSSDVHVHEVNIRRHLGTNTDYLKTISEEKPEEYAGEMPTAAARRKHQITFLAYQAKQRELAQE